MKIFKVETDSRERSITYRQTTQDIKAFSGSGIPETTTREANFREDTYSVDLENVPALKKEAYSGNLNNYTTALQFEMSFMDFPGSPLKTYSTTWEDVSKSIYRIESFGNELERKNYFEDDIEKLLSGVTNPEDKAARIFSFVTNKMNWNGYHGIFTNEGVKDAYKKGSGNVADINLMLVAMLRYANLDANPVLVSTKAHGIPLFPTRNGFNYVIAAVQLPQGTLLLDATSKDAEIGVLKYNVLNWQGRLIQKNGVSGWVSLSSLVPAVKSAMVSAEINPDLSISGKSQSRFTGNYAFHYRNEYKNLNPDAQRKGIAKGISEVELSNLGFQNLTTLGQPVSLEYDFETMEGVEDVAGKLYFSPMIFLATKENPFKPEERLYPIDFGYPMKDRYIVNIALPEGYKVESLPENTLFNLGEGVGSYKYLISQVGNKLQLSVEFAMNQSLIGAEDYGNLKKFYELLIAKENEKVVLSKA